MLFLRPQNGDSHAIELPPDATLSVLEAMAGDLFPHLKPVELRYHGENINQNPNYQGLNTPLADLGISAESVIDVEKVEVQDIFEILKHYDKLQELYDSLTRLNRRVNFAKASYYLLFRYDGTEFDEKALTDIRGDNIIWFKREKGEDQYGIIGIGGFVNSEFRVIKDKNPHLNDQFSYKITGSRKDACEILIDKEIVHLTAYTDS